MTFDTKNADGSKVFKKVMTTEAAIKSAKNRLALYLEFMKNYRATKPTHNSGGDNEPYSEILNGLEDLYDLHESFKNMTTKKRTAAADTRMRERAEGDAIRDAFVVGKVNRTYRNIFTTTNRIFISVLFVSLVTDLRIVKDVSYFVT
jgi:hypothetical protein